MCLQRRRLYDNQLIITRLILYSKFILIHNMLKKNQLVSIERDRPFALEFWTKNRLFLRPQLSLKSKTITNQERIGCLVYPEITQIIERSL